MQLEIKSKQFGQHWIDFGENDHFLWDRQAFEDFKGIKQIPVKTSNDQSMIIGEGKPRLKFDRKEVILKCKHAGEFREKLICVSKLATEFDI